MQHEIRSRIQGYGHECVHMYLVTICNKSEFITIYTCFVRSREKTRIKCNTHIETDLGPSK